jgi:hypothetical protein
VLTHEGDSSVVTAVVDPEQSVLLDDNLLNNAARAQPAGSPRSGERAGYLAQLLLGWLEP